MKVVFSENHCASNLPPQNEQKVSQKETQGSPHQHQSIRVKPQTIARFLDQAKAQQIPRAARFAGRAFQSGSFIITAAIVSETVSPENRFWPVSISLRTTPKAKCPHACPRLYRVPAPVTYRPPFPESFPHSSPPRSSASANSREAYWFDPPRSPSPIQNPAPSLCLPASP